MEMKELLDGLASRSGVAGGFTPDEEGVVRVDVGGCTIGFREVPELYGMLVYAALGTLPEEGADALKDELLRANFMGRATGGGTLSLSDDGIVYFHRLCDLRVLGIDEFMEAFTDMAQTMLEWTRILGAYAPVAARRAEEAEAERAAAEDVSGFMRV